MSSPGKDCHSFAHRRRYTVTPKPIVAALQLGSLPGGKAEKLEQTLSYEAAIAEIGAKRVVMSEALLGGYLKGECPG